MLEFNNLEEMEKYYNKKTNTYVFIENKEYQDIKINFDLSVNANITAYDISAMSIDAINIDAWNINAWNIDAMNIDAENINAKNIDAENINAKNIDAENINAKNIDAININAWDILYYDICFAYCNIKCKSIKGRRENCKHFVLDGKLIVDGEEV